MKPKEQHIKNFFKFLQKKERREIPLSLKLIDFPDEITKKDMNDIFYKTEYGQITKDRTTYFNQLVGEKKFITIRPFGEYVPNLAMTSVFDYYSGNHSIFIDKKGNPSVSGLEVEDLDSRGRIAYFNTVNNRFTYLNVGPFGVYGDNIAIAVIEYENGAAYTRFINLKGEPDLTGIDVEKLSNIPFVNPSERDLAIETYYRQKRLKQ